MSSTFGMLNTAYSGLAAARAALDVTGQNVANVSTAGYTRQRVDQASVGGVGNSSLLTKGLSIGAGVTVQGYSRLNNDVVDAHVRDTASTSGYWDTAPTALSTVETSLNEPGDTGLSSTMNAFWSAWQTMSNNTGSTASGSTSAAGAASALIGAASTLTSRIAAGYSASAQAWSAARSATASTVQTVNATAKQVATLNDTILRTVASGGNANELMDQRSTALTTLAQLTGATTRGNPNGTVDVVIGGSTVVAGSTTRTLALVGAGDVSAAGSNALHLEFTDHPGATAQIDGGTVAAQLTSLAGTATGGTGGTYAEAAKVYNDLATALTTSVNQLHATGTSSSGATNLAFFGSSGTGPAALTMTVIPTSVDGIATAASGAGTLDGSLADQISQIGSSATAPDVAWANFVSQIGTQSKAATMQSALASSSASAATTAQTSQSGVDLDEESTNLIVFQHAYQGAARVLTTIDQMLDTLINHTGVVGMA